jgi:ABC-type oligopeptide transport system substrate-binding subunit
MGEFRARISSGKTPKRAQASFDSSSRNALIMEKVQADVKKNLGLELALGNQDWKSHVRSLSTAPAQVFRYGWLAPFADPISFLEVFTTGNPNNYTGWTHTRYDELVREIMRLKPGAERAQKIEQAQRILLDEESIVVPLLHYIQTHAVSPRVEGFRVNPVGVIRFDELTLKTRKGARS